ncbi:class I SAM-dependent methyltransferase [Lacticaseibacillus mingshuiensis]|uniref:Class I SAM-dependent methyltransferase n=1 Tax=Lacticaseibacillus mingshuiensis TaxID=2799574 RepID=A0ABW4CI51_9LACO|nr:class I SAM-dependent methyltransferase [Lacticaseibacillus mingshuiensis]
MANELKSLYTVLEQTTTMLAKQLGTSFLASAIESGENLQAGAVKQEDGKPDAETAAKMQDQYDQIDLGAFSAEDIRQALQLLLVEAIRRDGIEPNKQVTPDAMASLATYLVTIFAGSLSSPVTVVDPVAGSGNLIFAVMNQLHAALKVTTTGVLIDNDEDLLAFAAMSGQLQHQDAQYFHQDALATPPVTQADLVVADLPVGYYPVDERAKQFATAAASGHSYVHHLLLEQSLHFLKPGGLGLFFVPSNVFQTDEAKGLTAWLAKTTYLQGLLNLPEDFFASKAAEKSLLVLQRPGGSAKRVNQVLLGTFPALNDKQAFSRFIGDVNRWAATNLAPAHH